ncbi:hypothetical protein PDE_06878 [Penicillium oxalicum 114-2]|uniref:Zn(2)-C6 fungal-type domain-containing protein n=1 Tax=Penicillium oxalicum (strain 114-2 / CGMCC 5302) TaxID=933388 RepID=S7ZNJ5_PENO1|nr:hypothetical protein PDE_06878 [Penicillium oxalicum 114-2]
MDEGTEKGTRRKRVSRACDRCRSKKDKCDGLRPTCSACQASGQLCSYDPHAKKRGLPEGYVRGLEKLWALSLCNIDGFEETMLAILGSTAESADRRENLMSMWCNDSASDSLHETWKTSRLCGELEKMLSTPEQPLATGKRPRDTDADVSNPLGGRWGLRVTKESTPLGPEAPRINTLPIDAAHAKRARTLRPWGSPGVSQLSSNSQELRLPPSTSRLLDLYFAVTHTWFPILAKHNILRASYFYANSPFAISANAPGSGDHAALWAILSYTIAQIPESSSSSSSAGITAGALDRTREYYFVSRRLIPSEKERYELGHIQALLLLSMVNIGLEDWTAAWLLSGQAVRMAIAMGLGTPMNSHRTDEGRQGQAVFLGCFVVDSLLSFRLSRSPAMSSQDLAPVGLLEEDGLEEWNSWVDVLPTATAPIKSPPQKGPLLSLSCFNRLVELTSVLNKIARSLSLGCEVSGFASQIVRDLKQWDNHLPPGCRLVGPESIYPERHSTLLPHQSYLGLTYLSTLLWLYLRVGTTEQSSATDNAKKLLGRGLLMMTQHLDNFPMCGLPPVFEMSLRAISEQALSLHQIGPPSDDFSFLHWAEEFHHAASAISHTWPVHRSFASSVERWQRMSRGFDAPQPYTRNGFSGLLGQYEGTMRPASNVHAMRPVDHSSFTSSILNGTKDHSLTPKDTSMGDSEMPMGCSTLHQPILSDRLTAPRVADRIFASGATQVQPRTPESYMSNPMFAGNPSTSDPSTSVTEPMQFPHPAITSDLDAIFKDLAYLDTTEWSSNREAGLKDFGFLDDSTFQAFCHDPDRLMGSQPLVHPPSIEDIWPPPGFFPETFHEPDHPPNG